MAEHVCGPPYPVKTAGRCFCCRTPVFEILEEFSDSHPLTGHPSRLGAPLDCGTQIELLMSNGAEADIAFCIDCARKVQPEHLWSIWETCIDRADLSFRAAGRSENERRSAVKANMDLWPVGLLRCRVYDPEVGLYRVDRR